MKRILLFASLFLVFSIKTISRSLNVADTTTHNYREIRTSDNGLGWGLDSNGYVLLNSQNEPLNNVHYKSARNFNKGRAAVCNNNGKWGFVDSSASEIIPPTYDFVFDFKATATAAIKNKTWFLINENGTFISRLDIDYFWGFDEFGIAKITKGNRYAYINTTGELTTGWTTTSLTQNYQLSRNISPDNLTFCPTNMDFESGDFSNWQSYIGDVHPPGLHLSPSPPTPGRHEIFANTGAVDPYGGFPLDPPAPPLGSGHAIRLGNPVPGWGAERVEYTFTIPPNVNDFTLMYHYALVFENPGHGFTEQPRFKVQLIDQVSGQEIACASVDYTAGYGGASFFSQSPAGMSVYYKAWTPVFINLGRYYGRTLTLQFTTMDCTRGGHWCYAYVDINQCGYSGLYAHNSCSTPTQTILNAPPGFSSYAWSLQPDFTNPLGTSQHLVLPTPLSLNTTVYTLVIPDNGIGCSDTLSTVVQPSIVRASFPTLPSQCFSNNSYDFTSFSQTNGGSINSLLWDFADGSPPQTGSSVTHNFLSSGIFPVQLTATNSEGCTDDTTINIEVLPMPPLVINGLSICQGDQSLVTLSGANAYSWNPRNGIVFTSPVRDSAFMGINNTNSYTITATDTLTGCSVDSLISVINYPNPTADFLQPDPQCLRQNLFHFNNQSSIGSGAFIASYQWSFGDDSTSNQLSPYHHYDTAGEYVVHLFATSSNGCKDTVEKTITIYNHPSSNVFATRPLIFCEDDSVGFYAVVQAGSGVINNYQWLNNSIPISGANQTSITIFNTGSYQLALENSFGCKDTSLIQPVTMHPKPQGYITTSPDNTDFICEGAAVRLQVNESTATHYQWYHSFLNSSAPPVPIPGADSNTIDVQDEGVYTLDLITSTIPACKNRARDTITLRKIKKPDPAFNFPTYCAGTPIHFDNTTNVSQTGPTSWMWNFGDLSPGSNDFEPVHTYAIGTNYPVTLTAIPTYCPDLVNSQTMLITIEDPVPGIRYPAINAVKNVNTQLQARTFAQQYQWQPPRGLNSYNIAGPVFNDDEETEYLIKLTTSAGCVTLDTLMVRVFDLPDIVVPTAFSPNNDGHNDLLDVFVIGKLKLNFFRIFNRWGQQVYQTTDPMKKWDGTIHGEKQPPETYVWIAQGSDVLGNVINRRGQFILIR